MRIEAVTRCALCSRTGAGVICLPFEEFGGGMVGWLWYTNMEMDILKERPGRRVHVSQLAQSGSKIQLLLWHRWSLPATTAVADNWVASRRRVGLSRSAERRVATVKRATCGCLR